MHHGPWTEGRRSSGTDARLSQHTHPFVWILHGLIVQHLNLWPVFLTSSFLRERESQAAEITSQGCMRMVMCCPGRCSRAWPRVAPPDDPPSLCSGFLNESNCASSSVAAKPENQDQDMHRSMLDWPRRVGELAYPPAVCGRCVGQATNTRPHVAPLAASDLLQPRRNRRFQITVNWCE